MLLVFNPEKVIAAVLVTPVSAAPLLKTASVPAVTGSILLIVMLPASVRFFTAAVASSVWNRPSSLASPSLRLTVRVCPLPSKMPVNGFSTCPTKQVWENALRSTSCNRITVPSCMNSSSGAASVTALPKATKSSPVAMPFSESCVSNDSVSSSAETASSVTVPAGIPTPSAGAVTLSIDAAISSSTVQPSGAVMSHLSTYCIVQGMSRCSPKTKRSIGSANWMTGILVESSTLIDDDSPAVPRTLSGVTLTAPVSVGF